MAEVLELSSMLGLRSTPKLKFRFIINIDNIDVFMLKSAARPQATITEVMVPFMNVTRKYAGKVEWPVLPITIIDYIAPSSAQKVWEKLRLVFDPVTGTSSYAEMYYEDIALKGVGPAGDIVEKWVLNDVFFSEINFGDLAYDSEEPMDITCNLSYFRAILEY